MKRLDWLEALNWFVHPWIIVFGIVNMLALTVCKIFTKITSAIWVSWILGIPIATGISLLIFLFALLVLLIRGKNSIQNSQNIILRSERMIRVAWMSGCVAAIAALFSHLNPWGTSPDFSWTNITDALITGALTYGFYRRWTVPSFLLFLYFLLWKMPLWSELQPKASTFAGMLMALIFWHGFAALVRFKGKALNKL